MKKLTENVRLGNNLMSINLNRNECGANLMFALNPNKRKSDANAISEEIVGGKKARLDDILQKMNTNFKNIQRSLKSSNFGITESPCYIENGEMRSYQIAGLNWLIALYKNGLSGILADDMGLGKTIQSISLIGYLKHVEKVDGRFLVVVPLATIKNWENEFTKWCPSLNVVSLYGNDNGVRQQMVNVVLNVKPYTWDVCLTTYETCKLQYSRMFLSTFHWHHIILDEGTRIKDENSLIARSVKRFKAKHRLILSGTPVNNNLHELWALISFLMPKEFKSFIEFDIWFDDHACLENDSQVVSNLQTLLKPLLLRRLKSEVEDIIPYKEINVYLNITHCQRQWYRKLLMKNVTVCTLKKKELQIPHMQLRKCTNHPYQLDGAEAGPPYFDGEHIVNNSGKMIVLDKLLAKLKMHKSRVLIFSQFTKILDIIEDYLTLRPEYKYCRLDGSADIVNRTNDIDEFQDSQSNKFIFLQSTRSGAMGINLTAADSVIIYDSDWNPQMDLRAISVAHRIGQTKQVRVFRLIAKDTIDEKMIEQADIKLKLSDIVINSHVKSSSAVVPAIRFGTETTLSNDSSYDGGEWDKLIQKNSQTLVDQLFEVV